jgi:hypothetical protein
MTDRKEALTELLAQAKAGEWHNDRTTWLFGNDWPNVHGAFYGSLDAAKALHEAVLPDWRVTHAFGLVSGEVAKFNLTHNKKPSTYVSAKSDSPARAWLIAILTALIEEEPQVQLNNTEV